MLNFRRNTIYTVDWAQASPPPGMPAFRGPEALAHYLLSQSIQYVAFSYGDPCTLLKPRADRFADRLPPWNVSQYQSECDFVDSLIGLALASRIQIYDDGVNSVMDLAEPAQQYKAARPLTPPIISVTGWL